MRNRIMKKLWSEFYEFIAKGNVIGLAVGLMMDAAFNSIITSMIDDILNVFFFSRT